MAETRSKHASVLLRFSGKKEKKLTEKIDLFSSELWKAKPGLFRIRLNGKWLDLPCGKKRFLSLLQVGRIIAGRISRDDRALEYESKPRLPHPAYVSVPFASPDNICVTTRGTTMAPVHQGPDNRWEVWVYVPGFGPKLYPASEITLVRPKSGVPLH